MLAQLKEVLADLEHKRWAGWQKHLHTECGKNDDGSVTIPAGYVAALERQIETPYADLNEDEKDHDRKEADNTLGILAGWFAGRVP